MKEWKKKKEENNTVLEKNQETERIKREKVVRIF
jgi:hypothetical protein